MKNFKKSLGLAVACLIIMTSLVAQAEEFGDFRTKHVDEDYILPSSSSLVDPAVAAPIIETYIDKIVPSREKQGPGHLSTDQLAKRIAGASYCFGLDPFVFAALIRKESSFDQDIKSPTGAVGFTQFTSIAIREVNDQLGIGTDEGKKPKALQSTIDYLNNILTGNCLGSQGGFESMGPDYGPLWDMGKAKNLQDGTKAESMVVKQMLAAHPEYAVVYGAIYLKITLAKVSEGYRTECFKKMNSSSELSISDHYRAVLMSYNGDQCYIQKDYQKKIMKFYNEMIPQE